MADYMERNKQETGKSPQLVNIVSFPHGCFHKMLRDANRMMMGSMIPLEASILKTPAFEVCLIPDMFALVEFGDYAEQKTPAI